MSGVSVRTLHHYDQIGLLVPETRSDAGYRFYAEPQLLRLQQILFYRELDFALKEIAGILDDPEFNITHALESHRKSLVERQTRIDQLLRTIDNTINHIKQKQVMTTPDFLYEGLPREVGTTYRQQAIMKYGQEAIDTSEKNALLRHGKDNFEALKQEASAIYTELYQSRTADPISDNVQALT